MITGVIHHYLAARAELDAPGSPFATTTIDVRGVQVKAFAAAPPNMRAIWEARPATPTRTIWSTRTSATRTARSTHRCASSPLTWWPTACSRADRVAIAMRNYPEWVVGYWATVCVGAVVVGMNAWWTAAGTGVRVQRLRAEGADRRRRAPRAAESHARAARRCTSSPYAATAACPADRRRGPT